MLSAEELDILIDTSINTRLKAKASYFSTAIHDWPSHSLIEPEEFISELKAEVPGKLSFSNLTVYMKSLDLTSDGWKSEALASIIEMFDKEDILLDNDLETIVLRFSE